MKILVIERPRGQLQLAPHVWSGAGPTAGDVQAAERAAQAIKADRPTFIFLMPPGTHTLPQEGSAVVAQNPKDMDRP
jgi:hypothetical protein